MYLVTKRKNVEGAKVGGVAGWLLAWAHALWTGGWARAEGKRQMNVVETLSLGGRKQLHLVRCGTEHFLVGTGAESVETIVPVYPGDVEHPGSGSGGKMRGFGELS
jgi:hypothetical protein